MLRRILETKLEETEEKCAVNLIICTLQQICSNQDQMGGACDMNDRTGDACKFVINISEGKTSFGRPKYRCEDNMKNI
jgi:hypothetical protein